MPIDFRQRIADQEASLEELLRNRRTGIETGFDAARAQIEGERAQSLGSLPGRLSGLGVSSPVDTSGVSSRLDLGLDELVGNQKLKS